MRSVCDLVHTARVAYIVPINSNFNLRLKAGFQRNAAHATQGTCVKFNVMYASQATQRNFKLRLTLLSAQHSCVNERCVAVVAVRDTTVAVAATTFAQCTHSKLFHILAKNLMRRNSTNE